MFSGVLTKRTLKLLAVLKILKQPRLISILSTRSCQMVMSHLCLLIVWFWGFFNGLAVQATYIHLIFIGDYPQACAYRLCWSQLLKTDVHILSITSKYIRVGRVVHSHHLLFFRLSQQRNIKLWKLKVDFQEDLNRYIPNKKMEIKKEISF